MRSLPVRPARLHRVAGASVLAREYDRERPRRRHARMSTDSEHKHPHAPTAPRLQERAPGDQLGLKDRALDAAAEGVTIADARLPDEPLVYANEGFARVTGYAVTEVMGRNCRFLQGPDTDPAAVAEIRSALAGQRECVVEIL